VSNELQQPLRRLLDADLIEKIPGPDWADQRKTYYRITTLGRQEIASDVENIIGGMVSSDYYNRLEDPALDPESDTDERRCRHDAVEIVDDSSEEFQQLQNNLRAQYRRVDAVQNDG
jgi:DNA-binding MarR family transcriptional regulator